MVEKFFFVTLLVSSRGMLDSPASGGASGWGVVWRGSEDLWDGWSVQHPHLNFKWQHCKSWDSLLMLGQAW